MGQQRIDLRAALKCRILFAARKRCGRYAFNVAVPAVCYGAFVVAHRVCGRIIPHDCIDLRRRVLRQV